MLPQFTSKNTVFDSETTTIQQSLVGLSKWRAFSVQPSDYPAIIPDNTHRFTTFIHTYRIAMN